MPNKNAKQWDLRTWIEEIEAAGELLTVSGADREEEIGGIVDLHMREMTNPAVLFDDIPGYPQGHRVLANILTSVPRISIAMGQPANTVESRRPVNGLIRVTSAHPYCPFRSRSAIQHETRWRLVPM